jgi:hypothetical protein
VYRNRNETFIRGTGYDGASIMIRNRNRDMLRSIDYTTVVISTLIIVVEGDIFINTSSIRITRIISTSIIIIAVVSREG